MDHEIAQVSVSDGVLNDTVESQAKERIIADIKDYDAFEEEAEDGFSSEDTAQSSTWTFSDNLILPDPQPEENTIANINPYAAQQQDDTSDASVRGDFPENRILPIADEFGQPSHYPGEHASYRSQKQAEEVNDLDAPRSIITAGFESFKYIYSLALLVFSVVVVMASTFSKQTTATQDANIHPALAFFIFWFLIFWLGIMEGGQGCIVGLKSVDKSLYSESHPKTLKCTRLAHKGDNTRRFIVGRQFMVVLVVFISNFMSTPIEGSSVLGMSEGATAFFLASGLALTLTTIMIGQLSVQINAANCMLDFINNYFMDFATFVSLAIEFSGVMHSVYLVQTFFCSITGERIESNEAPRNVLQNIFFWARVLLSTALLGFAFAVTITALFEGKTRMWEGLPPAASVVIFFFLMGFVGIMEGMQIALFAFTDIPTEALEKSSVAKKNCDLVFKGQNLQAVLIGRQICVTSCMFVIARITTLDVDVDTEEDTIFGVSNGLQEFFNTGLLGAVITTIVGSLAWRVVATSFPLAFLSNPLTFLSIRLCLLFEASGLCSASWVLARLTKLLVGFQPDEVYLSGAEPHTAQPVTRRDKDIDRTLAVIRYLYSLLLLVFSVVVVVAAIFSEKTVGTKEKGIHPVAAFFIFWLLMFWLAMMEGGQGALVGLQSIDKEDYKGTHPRTLRCATLAHQGDNMGRFIVGRQFLVVLVLFFSNLMSSASEGTTVLGLPDALNEIFFASGIALFLITIMIGQLTAQINAAYCMLDFINNYLMLFTTYVSLGIEFSGLLHSVYLVKSISSKVTGTRVPTNEPPKSVAQSMFFWGRIIASILILGLSLAVTLTALYQGKTTAWDGVPKSVSVLIFFVLLCFVGVMEGMQIALFAVVNMEEEKQERHSIAHAICKLVFSGQNLQAFLIGRQICVTICIFVIARITTLDVDLATGDTIFGVSNGMQRFFNTGILGAIITTIIGSLTWRIAASTFPLTFLSNPLIYLILRVCHVVEASGLCSASWLLARWNKLFVNYQPDEVYLEGAEPHGKEPVTNRDKDIDVTVSAIKYGCSLGLLIFCVSIVMTAIFSSQTNVALNTHPAVAFFAFWFLLIWLGMMEGGQGCLVGLQLVEKTLYVESHPRTYKCTTLAHRGKNMERFIVGRQFLVVLVVFVTNLCGAAVEDASVLGLSDSVNQIFLASGVAIILTTVMVGQLAAQINAANCMLDFINNYFMLFTIYVSLAIEFSGLLHSVYLVQIFFARIANKPNESNKPPRTKCQNVFFCTRTLLSLVILGFAFAVTLNAVFKGLTTMWDGIPSAVSIVLFVILMCAAGVMEGMQIALFTVVNMPEEDISKSPIANKNCKLAFTGRNLQAFLIGRQICVTVCMFVVARISTPNVDVDAGEETMFGVPRGLQDFFNTGLLAAVITTIVASLAWRVIASSFPLAFLSNPLIYVTIRICLVVEASGLCSASWLLASVHKQVAGFDFDEVYVGNSEGVEEGEAKQSERDVEMGFDVVYK